MTPPARPRRVTAESVVGALLVSLLVVVVFANNWGVLTPDTKPEIFLNSWRTAIDFARPWLDSPEMGAPNYNVGVAPVAALMGVLDSLGARPWIAQRLLRAGMLLLAAFGARAVFSRLTAGSRFDSPAGRLGAAIAYVANPYVIVGGGTTPTLLPYAMLPFVILMLWRAVSGAAWRWSAAAALVLAATSGLNAGVATLIDLVIVIPIAAHLAVSDRAALRRLPGVLVRTGVMYAALSLYWLVPTFFALTRAQTGLSNTESLESINVGASFAESLRGLGMWTLYGSGAEGPFLPGQMALITMPLVVILSFGGPLLAAIGAWQGRSPARVFGACAVLTGALLMSAPFPFSNRSAWGDLVVALLDGVPGAAAFRTLNKAGGVVEIGLAVLIGLAAAAIVAAARSGEQRVFAAVLAGATVLGSTAPAWSGGLFPVTMDVPRYWIDAATQVNAMGQNQAPGRVLITPGVKLADYSWGYGGPDELGNSLFERPNVFRTPTPSAAPEGAALLGEVDRRLQQGVLAPETLSTLSTLASVGVVLARFDTALAPLVPGFTQAALASDTGLGKALDYGPTLPYGGPAVSVRPLLSASSDRAVVPAAGALLLDGGPDALPDLVAAGLTSPVSTLLLAGALDEAALVAALTDGARVVLTDSNGRRQWSDDTVRTGPLLSEAASQDRTRALYSASDQTLAHLEGGAELSTKGTGAIFGPFATGDPSLAFDGDPSTAWLFGNFGTGAGNSVTVHLDQARPVGVVTLRLRSSPGVRITGVRVRGEGRGGSVVATATPGDWDSFPASVDLGNRPLDRITIEVTKTKGVGMGWVGFREIEAAGVRLTKVARTPVGLPQRLAAGDPALLRRTPVDVLLHRQSGDVSGLNAEEPRLERDIRLPDARHYEVSGRVRLAGGVRDSEIDHLLGADPRIVAESSSRAFNNPGLRASAALDLAGGARNLATGWIPADPVIGEWLSVDFPARKLTAFSLTQNDTGAIITSAMVSINDGEPFPVTLTPGKSRIALPEPMRAGRVRIAITGISGGGVPRVLDLGVPHLSVPDAPALGCQTVATIDGQPLRMELAGSVADLVGGAAVAMSTCRGASLGLSAGEHQIRSVSRFAVDDLRLHSVRATARPLPTEPQFSVTRDGPTRTAVTLTQDCAPCYLSATQNVDPNWRATHNGADLGTPTVIDGYAAGWRIEARAGDRLLVTYAPAGVAQVAWWISGAALLGCMILAFGLAARLVGEASLRRRGIRPPAALAAWRRSLGERALWRLPGHDRFRRAANRRSARVLGLALAWGVPVWASVGPLPGLAAAGLASAYGLGRLPARVIPVIGFVAMGLVPLAWYLGPLDPIGRALTHVGANTVAHQLAGAAIWLLLATALAGRRDATAS